MIEIRNYIIYHFTNKAPCIKKLLLFYKIILIDFLNLILYNFPDHKT